MIFLIQKRKKRGLKKPPFKTPATFKGHPWETIPYFHQGTWRVRVTPGFVNGIDPRVPRAEDEARTRAKEGEANALKVKYTFGGKLVSGKEIGLLDEDSTFEIKSTDLMDPRVRPLGYKGPLKMIVPEFFYALGVKEPTAGPQVTAENFDSFKFNLEEEEAPDLGFVKCEIYIQQARATTKLSVDIPGNLVTGQLVDYSVGYDSTALSSLGSRPRLMVAPFMPTPPEESTFEDRLAGAYGDDGVDNLLISTIYWVGPPVSDKKSSFTDVDNKGNPTWTPFVKHETFYNVCYKTKNLVPQNVPTQTPNLFVSWFVGRYTYAPMATQGALEAEQDRILTALFNDTDGSGFFWTA
jgi:hypothetical protein